MFLVGSKIMIIIIVDSLEKLPRKGIIEPINHNSSHLLAVVIP